MSKPYTNEEYGRKLRKLNITFPHANDKWHGATGYFSVEALKQLARDKRLTQAQLDHLATLIYGKKDKYMVELSGDEELRPEKILI